MEAGDKVKVLKIQAKTLEKEKGGEVTTYTSSC